jgi:hypothetical protein
MVRRTSFAFAFLSLGIAASSLAQGVIDGPPPKPKEKSRVFTDEAVRKKGLELVKIIDVDTDGDGRKENIGVAKGKNGLQLVVVGEDKAGAVVTAVLPPVGGREIARFEGMALAPPSESTEVVLEVYDETPDEKVKRVRVYAARDGKLVEIFTSVLHRSKNAAERDEWERDKSIISYGDPRGGWYFGDVEGEVYVRRKPQILRFKKDDGSEVKLLTGVHEQVWRFDAGAFAFRDTGERLKAFLPTLEIAEVRASSAWIEPNELRELKAAALQDALSGGGKGGERAMGGEMELGLEDLEAPAAKTEEKKPKKPKPAQPPKEKKAPREKKAPKAEAEPEPEIAIDRTPYFQRAADKDLATGWVEDDEKTDGKGQWVELELAEASAIHMVRVVAGCVDTQATYREFNVPERFTISLDGGAEALVDRREPARFDSPAVAFSDNIVKLKDRPWAKTTLVFFDGKTEAKKVRLTLDKAIVQGKGNRTCISEVSVH